MHAEELSRDRKDAFPEVLWEKKIRTLARGGSEKLLMFSLGGIVRLLKADNSIFVIYRGVREQRVVCLLY